MIADICFTCIALCVLACLSASVCLFIKFSFSEFLDLFKIIS